MTSDFLLDQATVAAVSLATGVAAGLFVHYLLKVLAPQYRAWRNPAPRLRGPWRYFDGTDERAPEVGTAQITQRGEFISVVATRTRSRSGQPYMRSFDYSGLVRNGQVQLLFEEKESGGFSVGNLVLKVSSDQRRLTGYTVYFDHDQGKVVAHPITFARP